VRLCDLAMSAAARLDLVGFGLAVAARRYGLGMAARLCELDARAVAAAGLKLGGFEWTAAKQGLVGFELVGVVVPAEAVFEVETGGTVQSEAGVAPRRRRRRRRRRKTTHRRLSRVHVAEGDECWSHAGLDGCGASVAAVRLVWVWVRTPAWALLRGQSESVGHIAYKGLRMWGRRGNGPTCLISVARAPGLLLASSVARPQLQLHLQVSTWKG